MDADRIRRVAIIGGGVIGAGWAARCLLEGLDVAVHDPDPDLARKLGEVIDNARRARRRLMPDIHIAEGRLTVAPSLEAAVADAGFVQESLPEREDLKRAVLARIDAAAPPEAVIASSTSGLRPTRLQADMARPGRLVVGHPFNPVYLLPLVEVCGGEATTDDTRRAAADFYTRIGMHPLVLSRETDGFVADRLLEALWREALWLVHDGVATTAEVDDAIRYGAGLRWAFMGSFLTYRIAGGEAGMRHFMAQFGPALKWPWTRLTDVPELTDAFLDRLAAQSDDQAGDLSIRDLERRRDDGLVALLSALRSRGLGAGETLRTHEQRLWDRMARTAVDAAEPSGLLKLHTATVDADWIDYNGHMTESRYLHVFGNASDALFRHIGIDRAYLDGGCSYFTVETHLMHLAEAGVGEAIHVTTQLLAVDRKRIHLFHALHRSADDRLLATAEQMHLHVDTRASRSVPVGDTIYGRLGAILADHATLPRPERAGRAIGAAPA